MGWPLTGSPPHSLYIGSAFPFSPQLLTSSLQKRMKAIMVTCFQSVRHKLTHKIGFFDLLGFDFMLDAQLNVSLSLSLSGL